MAELLAGEIAPAERSALDRHLLDCESCRGDFELARAGARVDWADVPVPQELVEATLASFREPPAAVRLLRWATAAAAVFGVAVLLVTSSRTPRLATCPIAGPHAERREILATMQEAVVGALVCKDEDGRPVGELGLKSHDVAVEILDGIAKTTVEENFENHTDRRLEGTFNFPLPSDASISRLALEVNGKIEEGTCLERERAREVFESIVRRMQDPALLEWQPGGFFKCRVFPIEPRSTKRVIVAYTQALPCFGGKMSYVYPLVSEKTQTHPPEELRLSVLARFSGALAKIESPSHRLDVQRKNANEASMAFRAANYRPKNDFVVTMEPADEELRVVSHRPQGEDGYFACFLSPRGGAERAPGRYAFVLDASASTSAPRLEVAKRLVRAMMERRIPGDRFEILAHNIEVERSGEVDLRAANDFMDRLRPIGGSDVLRALLAAGAETEVIYIGKGSPSFGESDPAKILEAVKGRRIRTIAVGSDANGLLLEKLGGMLRVSPNDDVDKRVAEIAATIGSPVISELKVEGEGIAEVVGARDLFYGERLVVSGRYREGAAKLLVTGRGYRREFVVAFPAKEEGNNYVRRLWAQRKVADLLALGESTKAAVTALGIQYQIMTPYTSFLVLETEQMWKDHQLKREVQKQDEVLGKVPERLVPTDPGLAKQLSDAERLFNARMFEEAAEAFDKAEARIQDASGGPSNAELLQFLRESKTKARNAQMLQVRRTEEEKKRMAEAEASGQETHLKREVTRRMARLLELTYVAIDQKRYDRAIKLCDQILLIDSHYAVAKELREDAEKSRHKEEYFSVVSGKIERLKKLTDDDEQPLIPGSQMVRFPSREEWREISKQLSDSVIRTEGGASAEPEIPVVPKPAPADPAPPPPTLAPAVKTPGVVNPTATLREDGRSGKSTTIPDEPASAAPIPVEDPKARAIREAYEEQLRRDRQEVTINAKNATVNQVVEEFRRQTGWNIIVDHKSIPSDYRVDEMRVAKEDARAALDAFVVANRLELDTLSFDGTVNAQSFWSGSPRHELELYDVQDLTYAMADFPGVDITLAQDTVEANSIKLPPADSTKTVLLNEVIQLNQELNRNQKNNSEGLPKTEGETIVAPYRRPRWTTHRLSPDRSELLETENAKAARSIDLPRRLDSEKSLSATSAGITGVLKTERRAAKSDDLQFPGAEPWKELAGKRKPKGLSSLDESINDEDKTIVDKLRSIRITLDMQNAPLTAVVDYMREISGLNMHIVGIENPDAEMITVKTGDAPLSAALRQILEPRKETVVVRDGVVVITKASAILKIQSMSEDGTRILLSGKGVEEGCFVAVTRNSKFIALLRVEKAAGGSASARVLQGLAVGRILPGDDVRRISDPGTYLSELPQDVRSDLASRSNQESIRAKMGLPR
jgi:hypothetical protein